MDNTANPLQIQLPIEKKLTIENTSRNFNDIVDTDPEQAKELFKQVLNLYENRIYLLLTLQFK